MSALHQLRPVQPLMYESAEERLERISAEAATVINSAPAHEREALRASVVRRIRGETASVPVGDITPEPTSADRTPIGLFALSSIFLVCSAGLVFLSPPMAIFALGIGLLFGIVGVVRVAFPLRRHR